MTTTEKIHGQEWWANQFAKDLAERLREAGFTEADGWEVEINYTDQDRGMICVLVLNPQGQHVASATLYRDEDELGQRVECDCSLEPSPYNGPHVVHRYWSASAEEVAAYFVERKEALRVGRPAAV